MSIRLLPGLLILLLGGTPLRAQEAGSECTYLSCALRVEPRGLSTALVRGAEGEPVARMGILGLRPRLAETVQGSDAARDHALRFDRLYPRAMAALLVGSALTAVPAFFDRQVGEGPMLAAALGGTAIALYGSFTAVEASRSLSRAVWWYNSQFAR